MSETTEYQDAKKRVLALLEEERFNGYSDEFKMEILRALVEALVYRMPGWVHDPETTSVSPSLEAESTLVSQSDPREPA